MGFDSFYHESLHVSLDEKSFTIQPNGYVSVLNEPSRTSGLLD